MTNIEINNLTGLIIIDTISNITFSIYTQVLIIMSYFNNNNIYANIMLINSTASPTDNFLQKINNGQDFLLIDLVNNYVNYYNGISNILPTYCVGVYGALIASPINNVTNSIYSSQGYDIVNDATFRSTYDTQKTIVEAINSDGTTQLLITYVQNTNPTFPTPPIQDPTPPPIQDPTPPPIQDPTPPVQQDPDSGTDSTTIITNGNGSTDVKTKNNLHFWIILAIIIFAIIIGFVYYKKKIKNR